MFSETIFFVYIHIKFTCLLINKFTYNLFTCLLINYLLINKSCSEDALVGETS